MDNDTFAHFQAWSDQNLPDDEYGHDLETAMLKAFDNMDEEDREFTLRHGWPHLRSLVENLEAWERDNKLLRKIDPEGAEEHRRMGPPPVY